jgi:acyl-CoA hydrolase
MKRIAESRSVLSEVILPGQANPAGTVHGGEIMKMMDTCGGVAAMRHAKTNVVTARVDELMFYQPINVGQLVICEAELVFTGRTSMEVKVTVKVEDMLSDAPSKVALSAYFTFVALDKDKNPCPVPGLMIETEQERLSFEEGKRRYMQYKKKRV